MANRPFTFADTFEVVADTVPDQTAIVTEDRRLTYAEVDERATRLAHVLAERGVGAGDHVGLYLYNGTEYIEAMLAAWKIRAVPINVNYRYVEEELVYLFDDADLAAVIHHQEFAPTLAAVVDQVPGVHTFLDVADGSGVEMAGLPTEDYETAARRGLHRAGLRRAFGRRPLHPLHRRHHGHAQGRDVAAGGHLLRRHGPLGHGPGRTTEPRPRTWPPAWRSRRGP